MRPRGINRGVAVAGDRVFMVTDHAHLIALNRFTGELLWETEMADWRQNYGATSAPLVVGDPGGLGHLRRRRGRARLPRRLRSGAPARKSWRFWTVPKPGEPESETWRGTAIEHGCAATWLTGTYDAALDTLYWPTGNPVSRLQRRRAPGRQPLLELHPRARAGDGPAEVALPVHAARPVGLGRAAAAGAGRHDLGRAAAQAAAARQPQRLLLRARSHRRAVAAREAVREEADVGDAESARTDGRC